MATTLKLVQRTSKTRKDGTAPIWLRITANRKSTFQSTGVVVLPKHWDADRQKIHRSHSIAPALNRKLREIMIAAQTTALEEHSAAAVKASMTGSAGSFSAYFETFIESLERQGRYWDWQKYRGTLGKLRACLGEHLDWNELDRKALEQFQRCLREEYGNNPATIQKEFQRLSRVCKVARQEGVIKVDQDPFLVFSIPRGSKANRRKLSLEEIGQLEALELEAGTGVRLARDVFILSFYAGGMRFSDVCALKPENVKTDRIEYRMLKTGSLVSFPVPPQARELLKPYLAAGGAFVFPLLKEGDDRDPIQLRRRINTRNSRINQGLKKAAELAGLDAAGLSMHVARHSFADYARRKSGNLFAISKALGHRDLATTQLYLASFDQEAVDQLAEDLWR